MGTGRLNGVGVVDKADPCFSSSKENTTARASLDPNKVYVIPNAIVSRDFQPNLEARDPRKSELYP